MTSLAVPVSVKFGRLAIENLFHTGKNILRPTRCSPTFTAAKKNLSTAAEEQKKNTAEEQKNESSQGSTEQNISENEKKLKSEIELLTKEVEELKEKSAEINDKYKRALADGENMRVRLTKQIEDAKIFGIQGFCKDLLEVADILGKATESVPKDELTERNPHLKSLYEGLTMTEAQLHKAFKKHGLVSLNPLDEKFDPNQHEALFQQEVEGKAPGTVVVVSKIGYKLHERIIRPALVGVAKG